VRQGLALTGIGLAIGAFGAYLLAPVIDRLLIRMPATDPVTFAALRDYNTSFVALAGIRDVTVPISDTAQAARSNQYTGVVRGEIASGNYFDMLGVRPAHGRVFSPDDDRTPNAQPVVVISDGLWKARFNADPQTIGRITYLNGHPFTIIGIVPPSFAGTVFASKADFWAPVMMEGQLAELRRLPLIEVEAACRPDATGKEVCGPGRETGDFRILGRLKPHVSPEVASAELTAIAANMRQVGPDVAPPKLTVIAELQGRHADHLP
jgi:hypothetical protein